VALFRGVVWDNQKGNTLAGQIELDAFRGGLVAILEELFETERNYILDDGEHFTATLAEIDATLASRQIAPGVSTLAAQVAHVEFLIDAIVNHFGSSVDWSLAWKVTAVTEAEWAELTAKLQQRYAEMKAFASTNANWDEMMIGGAFALVAHVGYHLGQIRQMLGILKALPA
jgi:hypothetical protein